ARCAGARDGRPRYPLPTAHRRLEQHTAADRGTRHGAAEAFETRHDSADDAVGAAGYFVFALTPHNEDHLTESRMFCPALGIGEDPVSGNAHGLLGVYLAHYGFLAHDLRRASFRGVQGQYLHRPGRVEVELDFTEGAVAGVWIVGQAVSVFETEIAL